MNYIIKRDGRKVQFNRVKIERAIEKAFEEVDGEVTEYALSKASNIADFIEDKCNTNEYSVEQIQDLVENGLMSTKRKDVARAYITYRNERTRVRGNTIDKQLEELLAGTNEELNKENSNKNAKLVTTQRDYMAGLVSTDLTLRKLLPKDIAEAHRLAIIHFHDADYFAQNALNNCCLINLEDMLQNGTVINGVMIEKPHRFLTASTIATQIILCVSSSQYGGCTISLTHLAPFVRDSFIIYLKEACRWLLKEEPDQYLKSIIDGVKWRGYEWIKDKYPLLYDYAISKTLKEINDGVQTFNYQVNSMTNTNGQAPFLSVFMYLNETDEYKEELAMVIEEFLNQRIKGLKNEKGVYFTQEFPKLLYVLEEDNIKEDSKYYYLTKLSAKCTAKRMVPDYISEKIMKEYKIDENGNGNCYPCMGCRSFLTPYIDKDGKPKYYGRLNVGVVTLNLPDIALSSGGDFEKFWELFEQRTELCHRALRIRFERVAETTSDVAPILWQHGAFARLAPGTKLRELLMNNYATVSLGYAGLYECVKYMTQESHTSGKGYEFAIEVMEKLNEKCNQWKSAENIAYSLYGSPIESTTYKFAKGLRSRFGVIEGITDRDYITNSYHVNVREQINAFDKLSLEAKFQKLSPGGAISYVEVPNLENNLDVVIELIKYMYKTTMYAEINTKSDYCQNCGYEGEIKIRGHRGALYWQCPNCGCTDERLLNVARRTCGYIGSQFWNQGRTDEINERVLHIGNPEGAQLIFSEDIKVTRESA